RSVHVLRVVDTNDRAEGGERMLHPLVLDHLELLERGGIPERRAQEEAVELRLWQRERSLVLDRVLRREEEERTRYDLRGAVDRHLALGHRLEQRRLRLRHRAVDLVHEAELGEDRARPEPATAL